MIINHLILCPFYCYQQQKKKENELKNNQKRDFVLSINYKSMK